LLALLDRVIDNVDTNRVYVDGPGAVDTVR
jgi:hypothetical protein